MNTKFIAILTGLVASAWGFAAEAQEAEPAEDTEAVETAEAEAPEGPSVEALIGELRAPDPADRVAAVRALGDRRARAAVPHLITLLRGDPLPEVRGWIIRALDEIDTPEAHSAIVTAAREDPDERVRTMSAQLEGITPRQPESFTPAAPRVQPTPTVPPLYRPQRPEAPPRPPGRGLRVAGIITTSVSYGLALLVGLAMLTADDDSDWDDTDYTDWGWKMMLPIVGPAVAATTNDIGDASAIFWIWSAAQVAGVTLLSIGYARRARWLRENEGEEQEPESVSRRSWGLAVVPGPGGLSLNGYF